MMRNLIIKGKLWGPHEELEVIKEYHDIQDTLSLRICARVVLRRQ